MKRLMMLVLTVLFALSVASYEASAQGWGPSGYGNSFGGYNESAGGLNKGYRGMVEIGNGFGWADMQYLFKFSTTHGYQFNPYFYLGGFVSFGTGEYDEIRYYYNGYDAYYHEGIVGFNFRWGIDARTYLPLGRFSPFFGLQIGMDIYDDEPFAYLSTQVGFRVALKNKLALNFAVQYAPVACLEGDLIFKLGFEF